MSDTLELLHQLDKRIDRTIETMGNLEKENIELKATISKMEITTEKNSEVEELKKQIEKMRNCANCRNFKGLWCKYKLKRKPTMIAKEYEDCFCICYDKWEFAK